MATTEKQDARTAGGGWNRKTVAEHLADGTYRKDRHGPVGSVLLDYPKPPRKCKAGIRSQRKWFRSELDELAWHEGWRFNERLALHAAEFFPKYLRHSKGEWAGKPFELLPWQRDDLVMPLFGWVREDGRRRFRRVYVEIPKKNGKSTLAAGIGLYMLTADGEAGAEVYSVAADKDQAGIVHREAILMADASNDLTACLKVNRSTHNIGYAGSNSYYRALASNPRSWEGRNSHCNIIDELHVWRGREAWDALRYSGRSRTQPIQFVITTAGDDEQSVCYAQLEHARAVLKGDVRDDAFLPLIYEASPEADWRDEKIWAEANPSLGQTFTVESLREDATSANGKPSEEAAFKRYTLNIWQRASNPWLSLDDWEANREAFTAADLTGQVCYGGLDLSRVSDMTALALVFPWDFEGKQGFRQLVRFWLPRVAVEKYKDLIDIRGWEAAGALDIMEDDYGPIEAAIAEAAEAFDLRGIAYDKMYAREFVERVQENHSVEFFEFPQTIMQFAGPTAEYERLLGHRLLRHNGNPVLTWQAQHVQVKQDFNANKRPIKPPHADHRKIDGIVAGIMGLELTLRLDNQQSAYEDRGVFYADDLCQDDVQSQEQEQEEEVYA